MRLWEKFSGNIFNKFIGIWLRKKKILPFGRYLKKALTMLDETSLTELKTYIAKQQHENGLFKDKAGNPDLYYSVFGYFLSEAFNLKALSEKLKSGLYKNEFSGTSNTVHLFCEAILKNQLLQNQAENNNLKLRIIAELNKLPAKDSGYIGFLGLLALYYLNDFYLINKYLYKFQKQLDPEKENIPSTLIAVEIILSKIQNKPTKIWVEKLSKYYRHTGGFAALTASPIEDLLSTSVCLFALQFADTDLRMIKPDAINFVESLYTDSGFVATTMDLDSDIEYTFYGILALASLNNN